MNFKHTYLFIALAVALMAGCKEEKEVFDNPYADGKEALGIVTNAQKIPVPASGIAGTVVSIAATGLMDHKDALKFQFNGQDAEIVSVSAAGIQVKVPAQASSGVTSFLVNGQLVFGPNFTVVGKVNIDPTFNTIVGTNSTVVKAIPLPNGSFMLLGDFTNYDNKNIIQRIGRITRIFADGTWDRSLLSGGGANSELRGLASLGGYYYIGGAFTGYAQQGSGIFRIARITTAGVIDTMAVTTYEKKTRYVSTFNGGVNGGINSLYTFGGKLIATGDFNFYVRRKFDLPTVKYKDSTVIDSTDVRQLARFETDGRLDSTWRFDKNAVGYRGSLGKSLPGGNGRLLSLMHEDGKILCYGQFTTFDNTNVGRIVRLTPEGGIDQTFNAGSGADDNIDQITYDKNLKKYIVVGRFKTFNGKASLNMVVLNLDGSVDPTFTPKVFGAGQPYYAKQLSDGLIVVTGDFRNYGGVVRNGFLILNPDGTLADGYNTIGNVSGSTQKFFDVYETKSADGKRALMIMGNFYSFDNKPRYNIVRVTLE